MSLEKEKCDCGKMAVWCYGPGYSIGENDYSCEDCVPRGCACEWRYVNTDSYIPPLDEPDLPEGIEGKDWKWIIETPGREQTKGIKTGQVWAHIDEDGREYPCCEYMYSKDGWDKD